MKKLLPSYRTCAIALGIFYSSFAMAQCPGGYTQVTLNWDYLDYFVYTGNYTSANGYLSSNALSQTQNFAFGAQRLTIAHNFADANSLGENTAHTGEAGSYGVGADINFNGNGTITLTFDIEVRNLKFSIYDLDNSQSTTITAKNALGVAQNITMAKTNALSLIVIAGSGTTSATATSALVGAVASTATTASINIDIAGPVKTITIAMGGTAGDFWISDIIACSSASFPNNYYFVSQPLTGMPQYVLHAFDKSVYAVNPANGVTKLIFTDAAGAGNVNSMAYDPYNKILYYVYSLTASPGTNKTLKKYDFNTGIISTELSDITSAVYGTGVDIPVTSYAGVESAAAAFYNGTLYLGIETSNSSRNSSRESIIWRVDFDVSNIPYRSSQVFAVDCDNGSGTLTHDWGDFGINNGMLYDFDGAGVTTQTDIYELNMITGAVANFPLPAGYTPGQICTGWDGTMYNLYATTAGAGVTPYIAPYIPGTGTLNLAQKFNLTSNPAYVPAIPSLGDASEGFRLLIDYGDAPASYDPVALAPAAHDTSFTTLRIGNNVNIETGKRGLTSTEDNFDDGIATVPILTPTAWYFPQVKVFNNSGANATLIAWLDKNANGVFDAAEAITPITVPSSPANQFFFLNFGTVSTPLVAGQFTFLRVRITSAVNGMTANNATGFYNNGEVEDYRVNVDNFPLAVNLLSFDAGIVNKKHAKLNWSVTEDANLVDYEIEKSNSTTNWSHFSFVSANHNTGVNSYTLTDETPYKGITYYRLKFVNADGSFNYSEIKSVTIKEETLQVVISPNPAIQQSVLTIFNNASNSQVQLKILNSHGSELHSEKINLLAGTNSVHLPIQNAWPSGTYYIQIISLDGIIINKALVLRR